MKIPDELKDINRFLQINHIVGYNDILNELSVLKKLYQEKKDEYNAKVAWCLEQVAKVKLHFESMFNLIQNREYSSSWEEICRAEIEICFLARHIDINNNDYGLKFIFEQIPKYQSLYPYHWFTSREAIVKTKICSICGQKYGIRNHCNHKKGEIYNGEMCCHQVKDMDVLGFSFVKNPKDKYTVLFSKDMRYNYRMLELLFENLNSPFEKFDVIVSEEIKSEYKKLGRNELCICGSGKKFKHCCLKSGNHKFEHKKIIFPHKQIENHPIELISTFE